jgi:hypothetical protein
MVVEGVEHEYSVLEHDKKYGWSPVTAQSTERKARHWVAKNGKKGIQYKIVQYTSICRVVCCLAG